MKPPTGTLSIQDAAKVMMSRGVETGTHLVFRQLRDMGVLDCDNLPRTKYIRRGWFKVQHGSWKRADGEREPYCRTFITDKGIKRVEQMLKPKTKQITWKPNCKLDLPIVKFGF